MTSTVLKFMLRPAVDGDGDALNVLIEESARALSAGYYTPAQAASAIRFIFGVDRRLIADGTFYVALRTGGCGGAPRLVGCGGRSKRKTLFGGDQYAAGGE